jgi:hypothetical protein
VSQAQEYFFHARELDRVSRRLLAGECFNVVGLPGIGKSHFLRHIELYWNQIPHTEVLESQVQQRKVVFEFIDFARRIDPELAAAQTAKDALIKEIRGYAGNGGHVTVCLIDHVESAIAHREIYDSSFFLKIMIRAGSGNLVYVFGSEKPMWELLHDAYKDSADWAELRRFLFDQVELGLLNNEEVSTFVKQSAMQIQSWKGKQWIEKSPNEVQQLAGNYPVFIDKYIDLLEDMDYENPDLREIAFDLKMVESRYKSRVWDRLRLIWEALNPEEKYLFRQIAEGKKSGKELGEEEIHSFIRNALLTPEGEIFSNLFRSFVINQPVVIARPRPKTQPWYRNPKNLWPLNWNRKMVLYAMSILLLVFAFTLWIVRFFLIEEQAESALGNLLLIFVLCLVIMPFLYAHARE